MMAILAEEIADVMNEWFDQIEKKDADSIVRRTSLQIGIHNYARFEYINGKIKVFSHKDDFGSPEFQRQGAKPEEPLTNERITNELLPLLEERLLRRIRSYDASPLLDYRFTVAGKFVMGNEALAVTAVDYIHEEKRALLLERIADYIQSKLEAGVYPTDRLESFFLSKHVVDPGLFPEMDAQSIVHIYDRVLELNKNNKDKLEEHRATFIRALRRWAETEFLPLYYDVTKESWGLPVYTKKDGIDLSAIDPQHMELALHTAILILKHEPNYSRSAGLELLERLKELGNAEVDKILKEGSGTLEPAVVAYKDERVECRANDVFATITIHIKDECADSYAAAIDFIANLLNKGFPASYQIKLKSKAKQALTVPGLAKSQTHRFFANALEYSELHPRLEAYARLAMVEHEWYEDTEGEKNCMPGTYAVFGLGLAGKQHFPLVESYMSLVDQEHQSVQESFTAAFIKQYGIDATTLPTAAACILRCNESKLAKYRPEFEQDANMRVLRAYMQQLEPYEAEHVVAMIWGSKEKLQARAKKEKGEGQNLFTELLALTEERKKRF